MKAALVELHVDLGSMEGWQLLGAIKSLGERRSEVVHKAIRKACQHECDLVMLPGWTLFASEPPDWLLEHSKGCTIVCELVPPGSRKAKDVGTHERQTHVLRDGKHLIAPVDQLIIEARHIQDAGQAARLGRALVSQTQRRWQQGRREALLLVCGEVNVVSGGGTAPARAPTAHALQGLTEDLLRGGRLILNPAHTPIKPQAVRDKRAWLSGDGGVLLTTANIYASTSSRSARTAAAAWKNGKRLSPNTVVADAGAHGFRLHTLVV